MVKVFSIFANKNKKTDKEPDYVMSAKIGEGYQEIGGCWLKDGKDGDGNPQKFFSCKLRNQYNDRKGYVIIDESTVTEDNGGN